MTTLSSSCRRVLKVLPDDTAALTGLGNVLYHAKGDRVGAEAALRHALQGDPLHPMALKCLSAVLSTPNADGGPVPPPPPTCPPPPHCARGSI